MREYIVSLDFDIPLDACLDQEFLDEYLWEFINGGKCIRFNPLTEGDAPLDIQLERLLDAFTKHKAQTLLLKNPLLNIGILCFTDTCNVKMQEPALEKFIANVPELVILLTYYPTTDDDKEQA